jgi:predicted DNA-binding transcriptional regulator AlpA
MNKTLEQAKTSTNIDASLALAVLRAAVELSEITNQLTKLSDRRYAPIAKQRGFNRSEAAAYIGVGTTKFDQLVQSKEMPQPKKFGGRSVWDMNALDQAFDDMGSASQPACNANAWD